ncbi:MAG: chemotaxis-specific protein-glutamate methyltransferase CheB [Chloroflexi bacterium]|nr:chemotaxis-specific protein-glutamate methyltransferase CheB [Chloroflexota bacterium]
MIRVLIVDDSLVQSELLKSLLESDAEIHVVGVARNGEEGVKQALALKPDLITMDIRMPGLDGFEATRRIMQDQPTPIVVVSSSVQTPDLQITFNAIKAGALDVIEKPSIATGGNYEAIRERLITTVKAMAEVKVIRRRPVRPLGSPTYSPPTQISRQPIAVVAMGASTGGPAALNTVLKSLPRDFPAPIVIVQHMAAGFIQGLIQWLQIESNLPIKLAQHRQTVQPGEVYVAPDDQHLYFASRGTLAVNTDPPVSHVRPSATVLFNSVAAVYGAAAAGVILTGMGEDGASGLEAMHRHGAVTFAQDEATCVIYGMPRVAANLGAVDQLLSIDSIGAALVAVTRSPE